jgi:hypothetical protein
MPLLDHFSILASYYERFITLTRPEVFFENLDLRVEGALLDAGGGTGRVSQAFLARLCQSNHTRGYVNRDAEASQHEKRAVRGGSLDRTLTVCRPN